MFNKDHLHFREMLNVACELYTIQLTLKIYKAAKWWFIFSLNTEEEVQVMANHLRKLNSYLILYYTGNL